MAPAPPPTPPPPPSSLAQAARLKSDHYSLLGLHSTAGFFADKAHHFRPSTAAILRLARHHLHSSNPRRALHLIQSHDLHEANPHARLLCGHALYQLGSLEECLAVLGEDDDDDDGDDQDDNHHENHNLDDDRRDAFQNEEHRVIDAALESLSIDAASLLHVPTATPELRASLCVLRARVYHRMDNPARAAYWYKRALAADLFCAEAFHELLHARLLTSHEAARFVHSLTSSVTPENPTTTTTTSASSSSSDLAQWIRHYYQALVDPDAELPHTPPQPQQHGKDTANLDVLTVRARRLYDTLDFAACADVCRDILKTDPFVQGPVLETYLAALVELDERHELFVTAHTLVDREPKNAVSWMAVGYYYFACGKADVARRFLHKATTLDGRLAPAWVAVGHAFGAQDESDQAMAAYRTASRLFPGAQLPMLFMGMEYARQSSLGHASTLFQSALEACPSDPGPRHELGVVAYRMGDMARAVAYFKAALSLWEASDGTKEVCGIGGRRAEAKEASLFNLGHCYRRLREFERARVCYERALGLRPRCATTCTALGMTLHCLRNVEGAVAMYHRALRFSPDDAQCGELLERALEDLFAVNDGAGVEDDGR